MPTTDLGYADLAGQINQFMTGEAVKPYLANLPNYANMVGQRSENTTQQLKGQLPQDVINQIAQQAAERGIANGQTGGPNSNSAYLRALGLNSLQMQQQGSQNLSQSIADTPVAPLFNPASLIVPSIQSNQELTAARLGAAAGGGVRAPSYSGSVGMPNLTPRFNVGSPSNIDTQQGALNSRTFTNGMWNGNQQPTAPSALSSNWWNSYGGQNLNSNADFGNFMSPVSEQFTTGADHGQFDEEDAWLANNTSTLDASNPFTYFE